MEDFWLRELTPENKLMLKRLGAFPMDTTVFVENVPIDLTIAQLEEVAELADASDSGFAARGFLM